MCHPKVTVVILNLNRKNDTDDCIESVKSSTYPNLNILLVDNGSQDNSVEYLKSKHPDIEIIVNEKNLGYAEGNNIGVNIALKKHSDYILLLNNDTLIEQNLINKLVNIAHNNINIGLVQPKLLYPDNKTINNTGLYLDVFGCTEPRGINEVDNGQYDHDTEDDFFYASGACLLISKTLLDNLNGKPFDASLFAYHEDVDLSWIARLLGYKIIFCPNVICIHKESLTIGKFNPLKHYWINRNRIKVMIKNYSFKNLLIYLPFTFIIQLVTSSLLSLRWKSSKYFINYFKGLTWNLIHIKQTINDRITIQSIRKIDDKEVMRYMKHFSFECKFIIEKINLK